MKSMSASVRGARTRRLATRRRVTIVFMVIIVGSQAVVIAYGWWLARNLGFINQQGHA